jgi:hypothetical protein
VCVCPWLIGCARAVADGQGVRAISTCYSSNNGCVVGALFLELVGIPQYLKSTIDPATGSTVPAMNGGVVTQVIHLQNSAQGQKPIMLKVKVVYNSGATPVTEQVAVNGIPPTL